MDIDEMLDDFETDLKGIEWLENYLGIDNIFSESGELLIDKSIIDQKKNELFKAYENHKSRHGSHSAYGTYNYFKLHADSFNNVVDKINNGYNFGDKSAISIFKEWRNNKVNANISNSTQQLLPNNNSSTSSQQEISVPKKRRRKGNAEPIFKDIEEEIEEEVPKKRELIDTNSYKQTKDKVDKYYKKKDAIKETLRKRDEENKRKVGKYYKRKKDVIEKIKNKEAVVKFGVDVENLRKHKKAQQLKDEAYKSTTLTTEERQKLFDEAKELEDGYDYNDTKARIEGSDREIAERYLNKQYGIQKNAEDYVNLVNDLEIAGSDSFDLDGNNVGETMGRKIELWTKGLFTGDFKEYEEYKNAAARLESFKGNREYNLYDVDELFNEKDELKNIDDVLNLSPKETKKAQDIFDEWQKERIENFKGSTVKAATSEKGAKIAKENLLRSSPKAKRLLTVGGAFGVGTNLFFGAQTYSEERKNGRTVLGAGVRAVADFALGEALGPAYMGIMMAEALPRVAVKGVETLGKLTREKNNMQRHEAFGYASFQDTQQLATMRQSGMEMAKMANYNLQQTLMGNEAKYLHR